MFASTCIAPGGVSTPPRSHRLACARCSLDDGALGCCGRVEISQAISSVFSSSVRGYREQQAASFATMEPITALAVASNVVQFVDFGTKLISASTELYRNRALFRYEELQQQADDLKDLSVTLQMRFRAFAAREVNTEDTLTGLSNAKIIPMLERAVDRCSTCATKLSAATEKLSVKGLHPRWESFTAALKSVLREADIRALSEDLNNAKADMHMFLLLYFRYD